ncbi:PREDICTED: formin-2-like [Calidris pugnax]|uniref:formin-2-like n=1 Tax=Calidris pugnax TaxID=198806 RepID=UPI00071D6983|nr:PREDICTED: formin-2-like [Calidris pugnax]
MCGSVLFVPAITSPPGVCSSSIPAGSGPVRAGAEVGEHRPSPAPGWDGALVPAVGSAALPRSWATDIGVKRRGRKSVFCFFSVLQITVKSCPPPALPGPPTHPRQPCQRNRAGQQDLLPVPEGDMPRVPKWGVLCAPERDVPHVPKQEVPCVPPKGRARPPCPSLGSPARGLPAGHGGGTQQWGGRRYPCSGVPRGAGAHSGALGWGHPPPLPSRNAGCQGGSAPAPHCTPPPPQERCHGVGGTQHSPPPTPPGCCSARGAVPTTHPCPPTAWAGSPGDPHPPGAPRSEPPHQPGLGEPPWARPPPPPGGGEGLGRTPGAN